MSEKFVAKLAEVISYIFSPLVIPTLGIFLYMQLLPGAVFYSEKVKIILYALVFLTTCFIPILSIMILSLNPNFDKKMEHHRDRILPFILTAISYYLGAQLVGRLPIPGIFKLFIIGSCIILVVLILISYRWKISGHAAAIGGLLGSFLAVSFRYSVNLINIIVALVVLAGLIGTARILLKKHTELQVYAGFGVGILVMYTLVFFS